MSEEAARIYDRARRNDVSATQAWDDLEALAEEADWDVERMLSDDGADAASDRELSR